MQVRFKQVAAFVALGIQVRCSSYWLRARSWAPGAFDANERAAGLSACSLQSTCGQNRQLPRPGERHSLGLCELLGLTTCFCEELLLLELETCMAGSGSEPQLHG